MTDTDPTSAAAADDSALVPTAAERSELPPLRTFNAFARFDDSEPARELMLSLEGANIDGRFISAVELTEAGSADVDHDADTDAEREEAFEEDVALLHEIGADGAKGTLVGGVLGAIGGTVVALAIPGVGLAVGAGILAITGGGAVAGAGVGAFAGAVSHTPASRSWHRALVDVEHGQIVIGLHTDERELFDMGVEIMGDASPISLRLLDQQGEPLESLP